MRHYNFDSVRTRYLTRGLFLARRAFMASYDPFADDDLGGNLATVLTPGLIVCSGISLEYLYSSTDGGAGTKVAMNLVGHVGVQQGQSGDLLIGLPTQMTEFHAPCRALYLVEARIQAIQNVLSKNKTLADIVYNDWVRFFVYEPYERRIYRQENGDFVPVEVDEDDSDEQDGHQSQSLVGNGTGMKRVDSDYNEAFLGVNSNSPRRDFGISWTKTGSSSSSSLHDSLREKNNPSASSFLETMPESPPSLSSENGYSNGDAGVVAVDSFQHLKNGRYEYDGVVASADKNNISALSTPTSTLSLTPANGRSQTTLRATASMMLGNWRANIVRRFVAKIESDANIGIYFARLHWGYGRFVAGREELFFQFAVIVAVLSLLFPVLFVVWGVGGEELRRVGTVRGVGTACGGTVGRERWKGAISVFA